MCRRLIIDFIWGNEDPDEEREDAGDVFDESMGYDLLTPAFKQELIELIENHFVGTNRFFVVDIPA